MKILFITSRFPYPPHKGDKRRTYNIIKEISKRHSIYLLSFMENKDELKYIDEMKKLCSEVEVIILPAWKSILSCALRFLFPEPFQVSYFINGEMKKKIERTINSNDFDVVHTHLIRMASYTYNLNKIPKTLDLTDAISLYLKRFANENKNPVMRRLILWECSKMKKYEKIIENYDKCLVCSEIDKEEFFSSAPNANMDIIFNGVDTEYFSSDNQNNYESNTITYVGNMDYAPNSDAIIYFVENIFPRIREQIKDVKLTIVGQNPPHRVKELHNEKNIIVTGLVSDVRDYYKKSTVSISPIRFGAGTLNKVLEPMSMGIPVVATPIGCVSIPGIENGKNVLIADKPEEFAKAVISVIKDKNLRTSLSENGRKFIVENYSMQLVAKKLENIYLEVIEKKKNS